VQQLHSQVCRYPVELALEASILQYDFLLSFRQNEYLDYEGWAKRKVGVLNFAIYSGLCCENKNVER
jgi:hypothetical protein